MLTWQKRKRRATYVQRSFDHYNETYGACFDVPGFGGGRETFSERFIFRIVQNTRVYSVYYYLGDGRTARAI